VHLESPWDNGTDHLLADGLYRPPDR